MKKRTVKKLVLAKETVRSLKEADPLLLQVIVGGWGTYSGMQGEAAGRRLTPMPEANPQATDTAPAAASTLL